MGTVEESVLRMDMTGLESQEEDDPKFVLFFKSMSLLGQIRSHEKPLVVCGFRKFQVDTLGEHTKLKHNRWLKTGVNIVTTSN